MDTRDIYKRLDRVFQDVFDDDSIHVSPNTPPVRKVRIGLSRKPARAGKRSITPINAFFAVSEPRFPFGC